MTNGNPGSAASPHLGSPLNRLIAIRYGNPTLQSAAPQIARSWLVFSLYEIVDTIYQ